MRYVFLFFSLVLSLSAQSADAPRTLAVVTPRVVTSQDKIALIIGNSSYRSAPLANPANDARAIADSLRRIGFRVTLKENGSRKEMREAMRQFGDTLAKNGVGLFYYAGHGMQVKGRNYLIPVDADIKREDEVGDEGIDVQLVLEKMDSAKGSVNLVILDACRDNPFARSFRSGSRGLAPVDAPSGTLVAFATAPGQTASDGSGKNGLYTKHLLAALEQPGLKVEDVFKRVRVSVKQESGGQQVPWENTSLEGDFYFRPNPAGSVATIGPAASSVPPSAAPSTSAPSTTLAPPRPSANAKRRLQIQKGDGGLVGFTDVITGEWIIAARYREAGSFDPEFGVAPVKVENGKWGMIDKSGSTVLEAEFDAMDINGYGPKSLRIVRRDRRSGVIEGAGRMLIDLNYDDVSHFYGFFRVSRSGLKGLLDFNGKTVVETVYPDIDSLSGTVRSLPSRLDAIMRVKLGSKWGLVGRDGRLLLEPTYEELGYFLEQNGYIKARLGGQWGLIDASGRVIIPFQFEDIHYHAFEDQVTVGAKRDGKWGFIDRAGRFLIPPTYDELDGSWLADQTKVKLGNKFGLIDRNGRTVLEPQFDYLNELDVHFGLWTAETGGRWGLYLAEGRWLVEPGFKWINFLDRTAGLIKVNTGSAVGIIDLTGRWVVEPRFEDISPYSEGLAGAKEAGKWGYIDRAGVWVIAPTFASAGPFRGDYAVVGRDGAQGMIDRKGQQVVGYEFDAIGAPVYSAGLMTVRVGLRWGYIDKQGKMVIPPRFEYAGPFDEKTNLALVAEEGKWGLIDLSGKAVVAPRWDVIWGDGDGYRVRIGNQWGKVDKQGQNFTTLRYDDPNFDFFRSGLDLATVRVGELYGLIDRQDKWVVEPRPGLRYAVGPQQAIYAAADLRSYWPASLTGEKLGSQSYESILWSAGFKAKQVLACGRIKGKWGCFDKEGKTVIEHRFDGMTAFDKDTGLALARIGTRVAYIDESGQFVKELRQ